MASGQLTAPAFSARLVPSFEGLRPSTANFASVGPFKAGSLAQRSFRGLVVRAATVVAPKVVSWLFRLSMFVCSIDYCLNGLYLDDDEVEDVVSS